MLAGGCSERFGTHKALHPWRGRPLIDHVTSVLETVLDPLEVWVGVTRVGSSQVLTDHYKGKEGFVFLEDDATIEGPMASLCAALTWTLRKGIPWLFVVSCDMPAIRMQLLAGMVEMAMADESGQWSAIVPCTPGPRSPRYEPLHALYRPKLVLPALQSAVANGDIKLQHLIESLPRKRVLKALDLELLDPQWRRALTNVNTREDLALLDG